MGWGVRADRRLVLAAKDQRVQRASQRRQMMVNENGLPPPTGGFGGGWPGRKGGIAHWVVRVWTAATPNVDDGDSTSKQRRIPAGHANLPGSFLASPGIQLWCNWLLLAHGCAASDRHQSRYKPENQQANVIVGGHPRDLSSRRSCRAGRGSAATAQPSAARSGHGPDRTR